MGNTWITDMTHVAAVRDPRIAARIPGPARRIAEYFGSIVEAVTSGWDAGDPVGTLVRCRRRPGRRPCAGYIDALIERGRGTVAWNCSVCDDNGVISKWQGSPWDLSEPAAVAQLHGDDLAHVQLSYDEHATLASLAGRDEALDRVVKAVRRTDEAALILIPQPLVAFVLETIAVEARRSRNAIAKQHLFAVLDRAEPWLRSLPDGPGRPWPFDIH